jgi:peptide/nickel transport system substrate-binding protein
MRSERFIGGALAGFALLAVLTATWASVWGARGAAEAASLIEPPELVATVDDGTLPPVSERVPESPAVASMSGAGQSIGAHGGTLNMLMGRAKDIRMMMVYGYARLVGYDPNLMFVSDILERFEVEGGKVFTFTLRKGHKWSDGAPFTAEDFRYYFEDVVNNEDLSPFGPSPMLLVDGEAPRFEVIDEHKVRYTWSKPNPYFLPAIAGARPLFLYRPAHYLKQFHASYVDKAELDKMVKAAKKRNWAGLHHRKDRQYRLDNVDLPSLQPWVNTTKPPSDRFVFRRNPYYHRIDPEGRQLPYIDNVIVSIASSSLIPAKTGFGESDLQARYIRFDHYTFLKKGAEEKGFNVYLWDRPVGSRVALYPNLNAADPVWRAVLRDVRVRRGLSLAINRKAINQILYFGLGRPSANTMLPKSPLFRAEYGKAWSKYDIKQANSLLDAAGLDQRNDDGIRLLPDGRPFQIIVDTAGESTEESDVLELIKKYWKKAGVDLFTKPSSREVFRNRVYAGAAVMSVWSGLENGLATAEMPPAELAPTKQTQLQWPKWGEHYETIQAAGQAPDMAIAQQLLELHTAWRDAESVEARAAIWHEMLAIYADQVFSIGTVNGVPQPVVAKKALKNVPKKGIYNWDPGAYFGIYKPDSFWFTEARRQAAP